MTLWVHSGSLEGFVQDEEEEPLGFRCARGSPTTRRATRGESTATTANTSVASTRLLILGPQKPLPRGPSLREKPVSRTSVCSVLLPPQSPCLSCG